MAGVHILGRILGWLVVLAVAAGSAVLLAPDRFGLTTTAPIAQVIAFRVPLALAWLGAGVLVALTLAASRRFRSDGEPHRSRRRGPSVGTGLATVLLLVGVAHLAVIAGRGVDGTLPAGAAPPGALTVVSANTYGGGAGPQDVAALVTDVGADLVALPETTPESAREVADLLARDGMAVQVFTNGDGHAPASSTALLVGAALGEYEERPTARGIAAVRADPVDGSGPAVVVVHPPAPTPGSTQAWARGLRTAAGLCDALPGGIVAGDFNATLDHAPMRDLGRCRDAASAPGWRGAGAVGTWHAGMPAFLGAPIDHVLADADAWRVESVGIREVGESDHRAVVARLVPRTTTADG